MRSPLRTAQKAAGQHSTYTHSRCYIAGAMQEASRQLSAAQHEQRTRLKAVQQVQQDCEGTDQSSRQLGAATVAFMTAGIAEGC